MTASSSPTAITGPAPEHADLLVLGFGKAGKTLAVHAAQAGQRVILVERSAEMYGGTCINVGCVPTKALIHSAESHHRISSTLQPDQHEAAYTAAVSRKRTLRERMNAANLAMVTGPGVVVITGRARFVGEREVEVTAGEETLRLTAERIVVNTGATPVVPSIPGLGVSPLEHPRVMTSEDLIDADRLPRHLAVLGAGFIGLELASMYSQFGSRVTVINRESRLAPHEDPETSAALEEVLTETGIEFLHSVELAEALAGEHDDGLRLKLAPRQEAAGIPGQGDANQECTLLTPDALLISVGRRPDIEDLNLSAAGIRTTDRGGIEVDDLLRTSAEGIWAVGDVTGGPQFTYVSFDDFRIVRPQLIEGTPGARTVANRGPIPTTAFLTPPFSRVGLTAAQARERAAAEGWDVRVFRAPVASIAVMPRPKAIGQTQGFMQLVADQASGRILGATLFCADSQEIINLVTMAMRHGLPYTALRDAMYTHPSSTEGLNGLLAL